MLTRRVAWALGFSLAACGDTSGTLPQGQPFDAVAGYSGTPTMNPGQNCLTCHAREGLASGRPWTVAGTVFPSAGSPEDGGLAQAEILLTDSAGKKLTLVSNAAGNFYTAEPLASDLVDIEVQSGGRRLIMQTSVVGTTSLSLLQSCNSCHTVLNPTGLTKGLNGAPGRLFAPAP